LYIAPPCDSLARGVHSRQCQRNDCITSEARDCAEESREEKRRRRRKRREERVN